MIYLGYGDTLKLKRAEMDIKYKVFQSVITHCEKGPMYLQEIIDGIIKYQDDIVSFKNTARRCCASKVLTEDCKKDIERYIKLLKYEIRDYENRKAVVRTFPSTLRNAIRIFIDICNDCLLIVTAAYERKNGNH